MAMTTTWNALDPGDTFSSPLRTIDAGFVSAVIELGGYSHPLFADPATSLLPGQAVLLVMGGMIEASGRFDESAIALLGFDDVRFEEAVRAGDELRVEVHVLTKQARSTTGVITMDWRCVNQHGRTVCEAAARMLLRLPTG